MSRIAQQSAALCRVSLQKVGFAQGSELEYNVNWLCDTHIGQGLNRREAVTSNPNR